MGIVWLWTDKKMSFPGERLDSKIFKSMKQEIYEHVKNQDMCRSNIGPSYLKSTILKAKHLLISKTENTINGFCVFKFDGRSIFISLICSGEKGIGSKMMDAIFNYLEKSDHIDNLVLESVSEAFGFYQKKGFDLYCPPDSVCPMIYKKRA